MVGDPLQARAGEGDVSGSKGEGQFFRCGVFAAFVCFQPVVKKLAGVEAVAITVTEDELDARAMFLGSKVESRWSQISILDISSSTPGCRPLHGPLFNCLENRLMAAPSVELDALQ